MPKYLVSELNTLTKEGYSAGYCGTKETLLTRPHSTFSDRMQGYLPTMFAEDSKIAQDQLQRIHDDLNERLPFLRYESASDFAQLDGLKQMPSWSSHFVRTRGFRTLDERTKNDDLESAELILGLHATAYSRWEIYESVAPNNHHLVLAKPYADSDKMVVVDPAYQITQLNPFEGNFMPDKDLFNMYFSQVRFKRISEEKVKERLERQKKIEEAKNDSIF